MLRKFFRFAIRSLAFLGLSIAILWVANTAFQPTPTGGTKLLSHRGVHQIYAGTDRSPSTCQATPIKPSNHSFIENTLPSMVAAAEAGADVIELDIHLTQDGQFAVFHDWTLDCKTNGTGVTHKQVMADLRQVDLGYNYSPDGVSFPLRGTAIGQMPTLTEIFDAKIGVPFLINFKTRDAKVGAALATLLETSSYRDQVWGVYGGAPPTAEAIKRVDGLSGYDKARVQECILNYAALGWSGYVPAACRNTLMPVPSDIGRYLWGWPHRFAKRLANHKTELIYLGAYDGSGFSSGVDSLETLADVPQGIDAYIWTNRIELLGPNFSR